MRIVYIEDNQTNVAFVERVCHMSKDEVIAFPDADTALAELEPGAADLILMDIHLGNRSMNGLELTRLLRQKGVDIPVVAISAYDVLDFNDDYHDAGCDDYVRKPVSAQGILDLIDMYRY